MQDFTTTFGNVFGDAAAKETLRDRVSSDAACTRNARLEAGYVATPARGGNTPQTPCMVLRSPIVGSRGSLKDVCRDASPTCDVAVALQQGLFTVRRPSPPPSLKSVLGLRSGLKSDEEMLADKERQTRIANRYRSQVSSGFSPYSPRISCRSHSPTGSPQARNQESTLSFAFCGPSPGFASGLSPRMSRTMSSQSVTSRPVSQQSLQALAGSRDTVELVAGGTLAPKILNLRTGARSPRDSSRLGSPDEEESNRYRTREVMAMKTQIHKGLRWNS